MTKINGQPIKDGAMHDTGVQFDSNNVGNWMLHCHTLYLQGSGMMTIIHYAGFNAK